MRLYGNLSHDNKIGNKHYFTIDIDVSDKPVFIEAAFLANYQYESGDTANINNVDYELTATPAVDQLFNMNEVVTCCIDMKNKKMLVINTHKASFDAFYVFNKFDETDRTLGSSDYKVSMFAKEISVPKGLDGEDMTTDIKIGGSVYINSQFSYEPEYGTGPNEIGLQRFTSSSYQRWGLFICNIDGIEHKIPFTVTHRNESAVFEKCFTIKTGNHSIKLDVWYSNYNSLTSNSLTSYFMGSNIVVMPSSNLEIIAIAKSADAPLEGWVIGTHDLELDEIKVPDLIPGTTIPIVGSIYGANDCQWSTIVNDSFNVPHIRYWNPEWGTGTANDKKLVMQTLTNKNSSYNYALCYSSYLKNIKKITFGRNTQICIADYNAYQYGNSGSNLYSGLPILDFSKCKSIKVLGPQDSYYSYYGARYSEDIMANLTEDEFGICSEVISVSMDPEFALITSWRALTNHYVGSVAMCAKDYSGIIEDRFVESWLDLNINGQTEKLAVFAPGGTPSPSTYNYHGYRSIRNLHVTAKNFIILPYLNNDILPNGYRLPSTNGNYGIEWFNAKQTSYESCTDLYSVMTPNMFPKNVSSLYTNTAYVNINLTNASEDERIHVKYEFDGNLSLLGYNAYAYFYLFGVSRYTMYNSTSQYVNPYIYVNHDISIKIHGSFYAINRSKINAYYYTNTDCLMTDLYPFEANTGPNLNVYRPYYSSTITTRRTSGDYWLHAGPCLYEWRANNNSWTLYDVLYQLNDAEHKRNIPMKIEIDGNFYLPSVYFYLSTTYRSSGSWDPYWNDYVNHPENVTLVRVKGSWIGFPDLFAVNSRTTHRSYVGPNSSHVTSWTLNNTPYSDTIITNGIHGKNVNGDPIHPYEVHVDQNAVLTPGYVYFNYGNYNTIFFCDKIAGGLANYCMGDGSRSYVAVNSFLMYPEYFHTTKNGTINFTGFADGAILGLKVLQDRVLPKDLTIDFSNVSYIGEACVLACACSGNFVWPTAEHPAKWMSTQPVTGENISWDYLELIYAAYQEAIANNEETFSVDENKYKEYIIVPSIDFNGEIVGSINGKILLRKNQGIPTETLDVDTWFDSTMYDLTHSLITADDEFFNGIYSVDGNDTKTYSDGGYYFTENADYKRLNYGNLTPEQFNDTFKTKIGTYTSYDYHGNTSNLLAFKYAGKMVGDIEFPTYTIGECIKHLTSFAFLGLPVRCKTGDDANFQFKEINLPNVKTIGEWAFAFGVWRGENDEVVSEGAVNYSVGTELVKKVTVGLDTWWIDYNPNVNEFVIPEHNTHFVIQDGYIYSSDMKILFRAVNNTTIRSYTAADGPVTIPPTIELIIDPTALAYDQRITKMEFTSASKLATGMRLMPPNLRSIVLPSDTSLAIDSLPSNCEFRIIDVGGSNSIYYQPVGGLASEVYSPTGSNAYQTSYLRKTYTGFASDYTTLTDLALPNLKSVDGKTYHTLADYGRLGNTSYAEHHFYESYSVLPSGGYDEARYALGYGGGSFEYGAIYDKLTEYCYTDNYNVIYFKPNTDGTPTRLNLDNRCSVYNCDRELDILGVNSSMTHPLWINGNIKQFAIVSESGAETYTVSADGKSLYYLGSLMHVATNEPIDEYHITTHVWPGAFYGCTIDKLYIDITAPDITVDNPLGATDGSFTQRVPIPHDWYGLFKGAKINKLYFNYSDLTAITMPAYTKSTGSTALTERTAMATPLWQASRYEDSHINEIHIIGLTQEILDNDTLTLNPSIYGEGITWSILTGLCPVRSEYDATLDKWVYRDPVVYLDTEDVHFTKMNRNMGFGVKWHNAAEMFKTVKYACPGACPSEPINCHIIHGTKINDNNYDLYYFWNGAFVFIDGDGHDVSIKYARLGRDGLFISGNPTSLTLDKIGSGKWRFEDTWETIFYSNRAPYGWENAATVTTDQLYTQMRVNTIDKFDKLNFDLSEVEDGALEICRGSFSEGYETPIYGDPSSPRTHHWPQHGYTDVAIRMCQYSGDGSHNEHLFDTLNELGICARRGVEADPANDYIGSCSIITRTAAETLTFLHDTKIRAHIGGRMNFWLNYGNDDANLTITPFYNTITNMKGINYSWENERTQYSIPHIQRCLIPLKNTAHCTWNLTTKEPTINVPAGTTPEEFVKIWTEARIDAFRYDCVTFDSDYWVDWQIFDMSAVYDCSDALLGVSWVYEDWFAEDAQQEKRVFFKKIVLKALPTHYDPANSSADTTTTNDLNNNIETRNAVRYSDGNRLEGEYCPLQVISTCMYCTQSWIVRLAFTCDFPWTEYVCDAPTSAITVSTLTSYLSSGKTTNDNYYITMTDEMWDDLDHIHKYIHQNYASNYFPLNCTHILVKDLTITSNCRKLILGTISGLIIPELEIENLDKIYIQDTAWLGGFVGERISLHNVTPLWSSVRSQKRTWGEAVNINETRTFQAWFMGTRSLKEIELMFDMTDVTAFLAERDAAEYPHVDVWINVFAALTHKIDIIKTNIPWNRTYGVFRSSILPTVVMVPSASSLSVLGGDMFYGCKDDAFSVDWRDFDGNAIDVPSAITQTNGHAFHGMKYDSAHENMTFPNMTTVRYDFDDAKGLKEIVLPSCTSVSMNTAGTVELIKVPTGCTVNVPSSVLVIFL